MDEETEREPVQLPYDVALSMGIFAINTFLYPDASAPEDIDLLELNAESAIAALADMRETVRGEGHA